MKIIKNIAEILLFCICFMCLIIGTLVASFGFGYFVTIDPELNWTKTFTQIDPSMLWQVALFMLINTKNRK